MNSSSDPLEVCSFYYFILYRFCFKKFGSVWEVKVKESLQRNIEVTADLKSSVSKNIKQLLSHDHDSIIENRFKLFNRLYLEHVFYKWDKRSYLTISLYFFVVVYLDGYKITTLKVLISFYSGTDYQG